MARVKSIMSFQGSYEDMTFYEKEGKNYFRKRSSLSKEQIEKDPNFVRTRENMNEFSLNVSSGKLLRLALGSLVFKAKDSRLSQRIMRVMSNIKNMDSTSPRGKRSVSNGIATPEGKQYLNGFDFNIHAPLDSVLFNEYTLDTVTGEVVIPDIITLEELRYPEGATHVSFQCGVLNLDFSTGLDDLVLSPVENLELKIAPTTVTLTPASMPTGAGVDIFILMISFYQEVNGNQYSLRNEEFNVLHIIDVV